MTNEEIMKLTREELHQLVVIEGNCPYDPRSLKGAPIGMFHCPLCGTMVLAGVVHGPINEGLLVQMRGSTMEQLWCDTK